MQKFIKKLYMYFTAERPHTGWAKNGATLL